jgi:hypothetical protein
MLCQRSNSKTESSICFLPPELSDTIQDENEQQQKSVPGMFSYLKKRKMLRI